VRNQIDEITEIRYFSHARENGKIFWEEAAPDVIQTSLLGKKTKDDVLRLVPVQGSIGKDVVISKAGTEGIGSNKARGFIAELMAEGQLHIWRLKRKKMRNEIHLSRHPQPEPELVLVTPVNNNP